MLKRVWRLRPFEDLALGAIPDPLSRSVAADGAHCILLVLFVADWKLCITHGLVEPVVEPFAKVIWIIEGTLLHVAEVI